MRRTLGELGWFGAWTLAALSTGCKCGSERDARKTGPTASASALASALTVTPSALPPATETPLSARTGSVIARAPDERHLLVLDEDGAALHVAPLPLTSRAVLSFPLPGRPAQIVTDGRRVWVTLREPSALWIADFDGERLLERARLALPGDAWGLALSEDKQRAVVSSAWTQRISILNLKELRVEHSLPCAREPRGVTIDAGAQIAFISHLTGADVTRLDLATASLQAVTLPPSPVRAGGRRLNAALGYAGALSTDGSRYFVARHALGALGKNTWFGAATVDTLFTASNAALPAAPLAHNQVKSEMTEQLISGNDTETPGAAVAPFVQPRALLYRSSTQTLLVAGEGDDRIVELDALAPEPALAVVARYQVGANYHAEIHVAGQCAAPAGLALSQDEGTAWVYCRASNDLAEVALRTPGAADVADPVKLRLGLREDKLGPGGTTGRKLFYNATDFVVSGGLACSGCHPEGRDDGHTWHEATFSTEDGEHTNFLATAENIPPEAHTQGVARRTPMLAGRVNARGPFGWHAESPSLVDREIKGFGLHRWGGVPEKAAELVKRRATVLEDFVRRGLWPPARSETPLSDAARRGRDLFSRGDVGCASCHKPDAGYTTRERFALPQLPPPPGFDPDPDSHFKIPALSFLAQRAPYLHDGSASSLTQLIETNGTRMGNTAALSPEERSDLVAFLETL